MTRRIGLIPVILLLAMGARAQTSGLEFNPGDAADPGLRAEFSSVSGGALESSTTALSQLLSFHVNLSERQSIGVNTEFLKLASFYFRMRGYEEQPDWKFKAVPITLTYERLMTAPEKQIVPVVGLGVSYYMTQLKTRLAESVTGPQLSTTPVDSYVNESVGMGWGAQATAGVRARISGQTFLSLQARYRVVNGFGLTSTDGADARFGVFDFAVGIGFSI